ncbi:MAG: hypothetical protein ACJ8EE_14150 [Bradyrhizobium sp.]
MLNVFIPESSDVMVLPQGGTRRSRAVKSRGSKRRRDAVQTRVRGGCSGGGWPRPSGRESLRWSAIAREAIRNGEKVVAGMPVKHFDIQIAIKTQLSQSAGAGAFDGQHGISSDLDVMSIDPDATGCAAAGAPSGAVTNPAIKKIASSRDMISDSFTGSSSHNRSRIGSSRTPGIRHLHDPLIGPFAIL